MWGATAMHRVLQASPKVHTIEGTGGQGAGGGAGHLVQHVCQVLVQADTDRSHLKAPPLLSHGARFNGPFPQCPALASVRAPQKLVPTVLKEPEEPRTATPRI